VVEVVGSRWLLVGVGCVVIGTITDSFRSWWQ